MAAPGVKYPGRRLVRSAGLAQGAGLARPKSRILIWPRVVIKMLAGLISR